MKEVVIVVWDGRVDGPNSGYLFAEPEPAHPTGPVLRGKPAVSREAVLAVLRQHGPMRVIDLVRAFEQNGQAVYAAVYRLLESGEVEKEPAPGRNPGRTRFRYRVAKR